jgi:hypothetical protein
MTSTQVTTCSQVSGKSTPLSEFVGYITNEIVIGNTPVAYITGDDITHGTSMKRQLTMKSKEVVDVVKEGTLPGV